MAVCALFVGFVKVPLITLVFVALNPPVSPPVTLGALQLYRVPVGMTPLVTSVGVNVNNTPLQVTEVIAVIVALGFRLTVKLKTDPKHEPVFGVTIYVAVSALFVGFVKVPVIVLTGII